MRSTLRNSVYQTSSDLLTPSLVTPNATRMGEIRNLRLPMRVIQFGLKFYF